MNWDTISNLINDNAFKERYCSNEDFLELLTDNKNIIKITNERLKPHFLSESKVKVKNRFNLYSFSSQKFKSLVKSIFESSNHENWEPVEHMGGYYFNLKVYDDLHITIWVNEQHENFGNKNILISELISDYLEGKDNICVVINNLKNNFLYLYNNLNDLSILTPLRLIRSIFMRNFINNDFVYFHAAIIQYKGKGILLTGKSGSGKTSTLLNFLENKPGKLIANDKGFIGIGSHGQPEIFGWPGVVNLGIGNLGQYSKLRKFLTNINDLTCTQHGYQPNSKYCKMSQSELKNLKENKLVISHIELAKLFEKEIIPSSNIHAIVSIRLEWNCEKKVLKKLEGQEKNDVLYNNIINNVSDQLQWIGYPLLNNNINNNNFSKILDKVNFYTYRSDFQDKNLADFLDKIV